MLSCGIYDWLRCDINGKKKNKDGEKKYQKKK